MVATMGQSELDQINAGLDRTEYAVKELRKKVDKLHRKAALAKTLEEMVALKLEVVELSKQLRKIADAVHSGNPAPHLRLVSDTE
jgi:phage shock protein A